MVLSQPQNQHVMKAFDLTGKVAIVTGMRNRNLGRILSSAFIKVKVVPVESVSRSLEAWLRPVLMYVSFQYYNTTSLRLSSYRSL